MDKPGRRLTLRQLMIHAEKCSRDLIEQYRTNLAVCLAEFREVTRPVRRRGGYPTMLALRNALNKVREVQEEAAKLTAHLDEQLLEIRERAKHEQSKRLY